MCSVQHTQDGLENFECLHRTNPAELFYLGVERVTLDVLHHHVDVAVGRGP